MPTLHWIGKDAKKGFVQNVHKISMESSDTLPISQVFEKYRHRKDITISILKDPNLLLTIMLEF
jgi:hypothetical protein